MLYKFMRLIVFFDLPMVSKKDAKAYRDFHDLLIESGYIMMQYSIYSKIFNNRDSCVKHQETIRKYLPKKGHIRMMMVTEKQYSSIEIIIGGISKQEEITTIEPFIVL